MRAFSTFRVASSVSRSSGEDAAGGPDWLHEVKFDGWRMQLHVDQGDAALYSKNESGVDHPRPKNLSKMLDIARRLSSGLDFIRVDLECEGTNYIWRIGERITDVKFTDEEVAELKALEKEGEGLARWKRDKFFKHK